MKRFVLIAIGLVLLSCGGSGGDKPTGPTVSLDRNALTFTTFVDQPFQPQTVIGTLSQGKGTYYLGYSSTLPNIFDAQTTFLSSNSASVTFSEDPSASLPAGTYTGSITLALYSDYAGTNQQWSQTLPVQLTVFGASLDSSLLTAPENGATPVTAQIGLTPADTGGLVTATGESWLSISRTGPDKFSLSATPLGLSPGSYLSSVLLSAGGVQLSIPVTLQVVSDFKVPEPVVLKLSPTTLAGDLAGSLPVAFNIPGSPAWSASSDRAWLQLGQAGGTGPGSLTYQVDLGPLQNLRYGTTDTATVTFAATGMTPVSVQVSITNAIPEVYVVTPSQIATQTSAQIQVYGKGFSKLGSVSEFRMNGAPVAGGTILSDTRAVLQTSPLSAGRYPVSARMQVDFSAASADMVVGGTPAWNYTAVHHNGTALGAVYDPARSAVFAMNGTMSALERIQWSGSAWVTTMLPIASINGLALSPDHRLVYVISGNAVLQAVDPDTMTLVATYPTNGAGGYYGIMNYNNNCLQTTNNNRLWFNLEGWEAPTYFDMTAHEFKTLSDLFWLNNLLYDTVFTASGDGSKMLMPSGYGTTVPRPFSMMRTPTRRTRTSPSPT